MLFTTKLQETKGLSSVYNLVTNESIQSKADMLNQKDDVLVTHWIWLRRKVWPRTWVDSLKVHGWYREKLEDRKSLHLESEMHISFPHFNPGHPKVLYGTFDKKYEDSHFQMFRLEIRYGEEGSGYWPVFLELFWRSAFVGAFECFFTFTVFPLWMPSYQESPLNLESSETSSGLQSCGAEFKGEKGTFRSPPTLSLSAPLGYKRWQGVRAEALSRNRVCIYVKYVLGYNSQEPGGSRWVI